MKKLRGKLSIKRLIDGIKGDKVILVVLVCLFLISIVAEFSASSIDPEVVKGKATRVQKFLEQLGFVVICGGLVFCVYKTRMLKTWRKLSQLGFIVSVVLFLMIKFNIDTPVFRANARNSATRSLIVLNFFSLNVIEVSKVAMVMYLGWAVHAWKNKGFRFAEKYKDKEHFEWLGSSFWQGVIYIFIPIVIICWFTLPSGTSSMIFSAVVMFLTILFGGFSFKDTIIYAIVCLGLFGGGYMLYKSSDGKYLAKLYDRFEYTGSGRIDRFLNSRDSVIVEKMKNAKGEDFEKVKGYYTQTVGARIAIHEGGLLGKGPGNSTQKYCTPLMFSDFVFSFLVEEYGLLFGALLVIILYASLLARGAKMASLCDNVYAKTIIGGFSVLISCQAFMHMLINVGLFPVTGQTLPLVSDGKSSLICFSLAFGLLLNMSKSVKEKMDREAAQAERYWTGVYDDNLDHTMSELDDFETNNYDKEESFEGDS